MAKAPAAPASDLDLSTGEMKQMLNKATRKTPYSIAFGLTKEKAAMLTMHKSRGPKKIADEFGEIHKELKDTRWGIAFVDEDEATTVKIRVKKLPAGMGRPLVKSLKGTGFNDVLFLLDDDTDITVKANDKVLGGSKSEPDEEGGQAAAAPTAPTAPPMPPTQEKYNPAELEEMLRTLRPRIPGAAGTDAALLAQLTKYANDANLNIKTNNLNTAAELLQLLSDALDRAAEGGSQAAAAGQAELGAALRKQLDALTPRIKPAGEKMPALLAPLTKLATDADAALKVSNMMAAGTAIKKLGEALDKVVPAGAATAAPTQPPPADLGKVRTVWQTAQQKVTTDIDKLRVQLVDTYKAEGISGEVEQRFTAAVSKLLQAMKPDLGKMIDDIGGAPDAATRKTLVDGAQQVITGYKTALADPIVPDLDKNPFVPLGVQNALKVLTTLETSIH